MRDPSERGDRLTQLARRALGDSASRRLRKLPYSGCTAYAEMTGIKPGYIKRADLAWYCSHHHNVVGENVSYSYSYLFAYAIDLPAGTKTMTLPDNDKIRVLAVSVADENQAVKPVQPLYDVFPLPATGGTP